MCDEGTNNQLQDENCQLKCKIKLLERRVVELEAKLAKYENPHTPPSLKRGRNRGKGDDEGGKGKPSQKEGHKGVTRDRPRPDEIVKVTANRCPDCGAELGDPISIVSRIWTFTTPFETFYVIRKSRGMKVLTEVLTRKFKGIIVCDGWKSYMKFTKRLQRCWAHLLRETKDLAENVLEAVPLHVRRKLWNMGRATLWRWITGEYVNEKLRKLIGKISNGFEFWFTFVIHPGVEPTNNRAERALREQVVLRKILGTLRNDKGTSIHECITTMLVTWGQQGLNSLQMLKTSLAS